MNFTEKDIQRYIDKRTKLERDLADERAYGNASKTTLRKIEELNRIIDYDNLKNSLEELARKALYYEDLLKRHNISYLK